MLHIIAEAHSYRILGKLQIVAAAPLRVALLSHKYSRSIFAHINVYTQNISGGWGKLSMEICECALDARDTGFAIWLFI